jgi:hypothetical protein
MIQAPPITSWPVATRSRVAKAIFDAALPTCGYLFEHRDGAWRVEPISELPQQYIEPPRDAVFGFLVEQLSPALAVLKTLYGIEDEPPVRNLTASPPPDSLCDEAVAAPKRRTRKPSIAELVKQAEKTGRRVTSVTTPDGMIINFGEPEPAALDNPWPLDEFRTKETKQ